MSNYAVLLFKVLNVEFIVKLVFATITLISS
jgi:hypothetical protein